MHVQGDHSPDNVKFPGISLTVRGTHAHTSTEYLYGCKYEAYNEQFQATFPWQDFSPDISLTFSKIPDISLTAIKFPDISRLFRQVVTLIVISYILNIVTETNHDRMNKYGMFKGAVSKPPPLA